VFPNQRVNLSVIDTGFVWEVKSPCCYSRGVVFTVENVYIFVFGSQKATWDEVNTMYGYQTIKLLEYYEKSVPESFYNEINNQSSVQD
jgi:hypothetical protein